MDCTGTGRVCVTTNGNDEKGERTLPSLEKAATLTVVTALRMAIPWENVGKIMIELLSLFFSQYVRIALVCTVVGRLRQRVLSV